jgi:hypothetical protein
VNVITTGREHKIQTSRNNDIGEEEIVARQRQGRGEIIDRRQARLLEEKTPPWNGLKTTDRLQTGLRMRG